MHIYPDYYIHFRCIADRCRHNCCIGWEIDIDAETASMYRNIPGALGDRLRANIAGDPPHFVLDAHERCPFLNGQGLCDIITALGEDGLCDICAMHPRFVNTFATHTELGIGLACEEAARLILTKESPAVLVGQVPKGNALLALRDRVIGLLQDRTRPIEARAEAVLALCDLPPLGRIEAYAEAFLSLERLDEAWTAHLRQLSSAADTAAFDRHMAERETEYEQLLVYLVYRHMAGAADLAEAAARAAFSVLCYRLLHALGARLYQSGGFTVADQIELCRMFSAEIEYSEENTEALFALLQG